MSRRAMGSKPRQYRARPWGLIAPAFAALAVAAAAHAASPSAPIHRIVAVGDLHGDFAAWRAIARDAGLEDAQGRWSGGASVLVQTGDMVDRGPDSLKIVQDFMRLQKEAPRAGGRVVTLVGNHEAMNLAGDLRYVSAGDYAAFADADSARRRDQAYAANRPAIEAAARKADPNMSAEAIRQAWIAATPLGAVEHQAAWNPAGRIGRWVASEPAVAMLDGTLFVHGGISAAYAKMTVAEINRRVDAALAAGDTAEGSIINDDDGPLWYRGLVLRPKAATPPAAPVSTTKVPLSMAQELAVVLQAYRARRMVIGHTPILSGIAVLDGGRLVRIDTGISEAFGGKLGWLEIVDGTLVPHETPRPAASTGGGAE